MTKLLQFPKPPPLDTIEHTINVYVGADRFTMKIHAEIVRFTGQEPSPSESQCRTLEFCKLVPEPEGGDRGGDRGRGADGSSAEANTGAKSEIPRNDTATAQSPVATVGAHRPNVASRVGRAGKKANRSIKAATSETPGKGRAG